MSVALSSSSVGIASIWDELPLEPEPPADDDMWAAPTFSRKDKKKKKKKGRLGRPWPEFVLHFVDRDIASICKDLEPEPAKSDAVPGTADYGWGC